MGIRQFKPVTAGTRFRSVSDFAEITRAHAGEVAARADQEVGRSRQPRPHLDASHRAAGTSAVPHHRLQAQQVRRAGQRCARSSTIRTARRASRWSSTRTARSATSCTRRGWKSATRSVAGRAPTCDWATRCRWREMPLGTDGAQRRAQDRQGRPDGALGRRRRPGGGEGRRLRHAAPAGRPKCAWCTARCLATIGEVGNAEHELQLARQGGQEPLAGQAPEGARRSR